MKSLLLVSRLFNLWSRTTAATAVGSIALCISLSAAPCTAQQTPIIKPVAPPPSQLSKPSVQLAKPLGESVLKSALTQSQNPVLRVIPRQATPQSALQSPMMGGMQQRMDERNLRSRVVPGTRDEILERHGEQMKRHELCRRLEQRRQELLLERKEQEQKSTK